MCIINPCAIAIAKCIATHENDFADNEMLKVPAPSSVSSSRAMQSSLFLILALTSPQLKKRRQTQHSARTRCGSTWWRTASRACAGCTWRVPAVAQVNWFNTHFNAQFGDDKLAVITFERCAHRRQGDGARAGLHTDERGRAHATKDGIYDQARTGIHHFKI